jgi:hypothetical protein
MRLNDGIIQITSDFSMEMRIRVIFNGRLVDFIQCDIREIRGIPRNPFESPCLNEILEKIVVHFEIVKESFVAGNQKSKPFGPNRAKSDVHWNHHRLGISIHSHNTHVLCYLYYF